jgi:hypothetical protein
MIVCPFYVWTLHKSHTYPCYKIWKALTNNSACLGQAAALTGTLKERVSLTPHNPCLARTRTTSTFKRLSARDIYWIYLSAELCSFVL